MAKDSPDLEVDEHGFMTLPLPAPNWFHHRPLPQLPHFRFHLKRLSPKLEQKLWLGGMVAGGIFGLFLLVGFFAPSNLKFSFAGSTCAFNPQLLPNLTDHHANKGFESYSTATIGIFGYPLFSHQTCVRPSSVPLANQETELKLSPLSLPLLHKSISVSVGELPQATPKTTPETAVSASAPMMFELSQADEVFSYQLSVNEKSVECEADGTELSCPLEELALGQGAAYDFKLERQFENEPAGKLVESKLTTLDPVVLASSSITPDSTVFHKPTEVVMTFNKNLVSAENVVLKQLEPAGSDQQTSFETKDNQLTVKFQGELPRETLFGLSIGQLTADDGSNLAGPPLILRFRTSGGPKVAGVSIGSYRVDPGASVTISFDSNLGPGQNFAGFAILEVGGRAVAAAVSASGNRITINPSSSLPRCTGFNVKINGGLVNEHGIGGGTAWNMSSRTICQSVFSVGRSVRGRGITGYRFGSGGSKIVFVGGMHGNEKSSVATLSAWVDYLERHAHEIPAHRSVIVIPNSNPDAYASSRRTNANNVDLNRNFPSNDWSTAVQMPGNQFLPNGGGMTPLDQPESSALASFIQRENPRVVLTYHATARIIISNDSGDSVSLGHRYASDAGYTFSSGANSGGTFEYATTGEFEDWLADKEGIPALLVELASMSRNELATHQRAMWNVVNIP